MQVKITQKSQKFCNFTIKYINSLKIIYEFLRIIDHHNSQEKLFLKKACAFSEMFLHFSLSERVGYKMFIFFKI